MILETLNKKKFHFLSFNSTQERTSIMMLVCTIQLMKHLLNYDVGMYKVKMVIGVCTIVMLEYYLILNDLVISTNSKILILF